MSGIGFKERFEACDDENPVILEQCIVEAEKIMFKKLAPETCEIMKASKLYDEIQTWFYETFYWNYHAKHYEYVL